MRKQRALETGSAVSDSRTSGVHAYNESSVVLNIPMLTQKDYQEHSKRLYVKL